MGFTSILFGEWEQTLKTDMPGFFKDLQLDYLLEQIKEFTKGYRIAPYFYTFPRQKELIVYRQQVGKDMESEELCEALRDFSIRLQKSRQVYQLSLQSEGTVQKATYHLQAAGLYREALVCLQQEMKTLQVQSAGLQAFRVYLDEQVNWLTESGFEEGLRVAETFFSKLTFSLSVDKDKLLVEEGSKDGKNYFERLAELLQYPMQKKDTVMTDVFPEPLELSYFESVLVGILKKSKPQVFEGIRAFYDAFPSFYSEIILRFDEEVQLYLGFEKFRRKTERMGYPMSVPTVTEATEFFGKGVYDLALVWKHADQNYPVVSNDFSMPQQPSFFVVTGPNQGGKTTFARSVGQAVYFSLMGLAANAESLTVPLFGGISTHFETEESMESNSGKLKEEINRLVPMVTGVHNKNQFVILNELFTTATTHDAMVMGRKVMEYFLERECHGIYVTHIQELAEETDSIISLVAQLAPGEEGKRTYRILPMPAEGQGYSDVLVKKYSLTYEEIVRRLA